MTQYEKDMERAIDSAEGINDLLRRMLMVYHTKEDLAVLSRKTGVQACTITNIKQGRQGAMVSTLETLMDGMGYTLVPIKKGGQ